MSVYLRHEPDANVPTRGQASLARFIRFGCVGSFVFLLDFSLVHLLGKVLTPLLAVSIAFFTGVIAHFCLNKWWVFGARQRCTSRELFAYGVNVLLCWCCTLCCVKAALTFVTKNLLVAKMIAVGPTMVLGFCLLRFVVFAPASQPNGD